MLTCFSSKFICSTSVFLLFKRRRLFGSDVWDCFLFDPYFGMLYFIIFSWSVVIGFQELLHSDGGPFSDWLCQNGASFDFLFLFMPNFVVQVLLCEEFEISDYFIVTDFASLSKATLEEIHSLIVPGLCLFCDLFWLVFPAMMIPERFRSSAANYLFTVHWNQSFHGTFLFHLPTWNGTSDTFWRIEIRDTSFRLGILLISLWVFSFPFEVWISFLHPHINSKRAKSQRIIDRFLSYFSTFRKTSM